MSRTRPDVPPSSSSFRAWPSAAAGPAWCASRARGACPSPCARKEEERRVSSVLGSVKRCSSSRRRSKRRKWRSGASETSERDVLVLYPRFEQARDAPLLQQRADDADLGADLRAGEGAASVVRLGELGRRSQGESEAEKEGRTHRCRADVEQLQLCADAARDPPVAGPCEGEEDERRAVVDEPGKEATVRIARGVAAGLGDGEVAGDGG